MNLDILCRCRSLTMVYLTECCMLTVHRKHTLISIPSYLTKFLEENHQNSNGKSLHESQHILQSNLSQIHSYHGVKRPKKKRNSNLWEVYFSSAAAIENCMKCGISPQTSHQGEILHSLIFFLLHN